MDQRSRKWQITINNPHEKGYTHDVIEGILAQMRSLVYWCLSDEIGGETNTFHTHIFICASNAIRFSTLQNKFAGGHFEICEGTAQINRDYVFKEGKWKDDKKADTNIVDSHMEWGEIPIERQGKRNDLDDLYDMIRSGMSNGEIIEECPRYMMYIDKIDRARMAIQSEKYRDKWRELETVYIYGVTGAGKTRSVMDTYGYRNVYRVTNYDNPFDGYIGQEVIAFEEFSSSLKIQDMLKYLDGYPCELPARFCNKQACYTKVYILSNDDLREQYQNVQRDKPRVWDAFLRRIKEVHIYDGGCIRRMTLGEYMHGFSPCIGDTPFGK